MRLLLDECIGQRSLRDDLVAAGHDVLRSVDAFGSGAGDDGVFEYPRTQNRAVVTYNADFILLAKRTSEHAGLLLIYEENKPTDMSTPTTLKAIQNAALTYGDAIAGETLMLNAFQW